ncbi:MAG: hypothetical protein EOL86_14260 [Deltaproteobacteria bacterium]|nr:hypothetical protein [Deltaproteobacteria bacterium]
MMPMTRLAILALILTLTASPASAFKFFGPNGEMSDSPEDIARRKADAEIQARQDQRNAASERAWQEEQARIQEHNARMNAMYRAGNQPAQEVRVQPINKYNDGPAPGGHYRHLWRKQTGFNTPAERTRYIRENRRLQRELAKERAKPNPRGATVQEMRAKRKRAN